MNEYRYVINDESFELRSDWNSENHEYVAQDAAQDYYENHDGFESDWPIEIDVFDRDHNHNWVKIGTHSIDVVTEPNFVTV